MPEEVLFQIDVGGILNFLLFAIMSIIVAWMRSRMLGQERDVRLAYREIQESDKKIETLLRLIQELAKAEENTAKMIMTAFTSSKLEAPAKMEIMRDFVKSEEIYTKIDQIAGEVSSKYIDQVVERINSRNKFLGNLADNAGGEIKRQIATHLEAGQSYVESLISKRGD